MRTIVKAAGLIVNIATVRLTPQSDAVRATWASGWSIAILVTPGGCAVAGLLSSARIAVVLLFAAALMWAR